VEPLALLVHPRQPLSYLERLIQAEVPSIKGDNSDRKPPSVCFLAVEVQDDTINPETTIHKYNSKRKDARDVQREDDRLLHHLKGCSGGVEQHHHLDDDESTTIGRMQFVRWSSSTEIGDFIRNAARAKEFLVEIETSPPGIIPVGVPSFNDRTHYLRMRLRRTSTKLKNLAAIRHECDVLAHRGAQRVALCGFGVLVFWWYLVYKLTFGTDLGWDVMEPITYLVSLSTLMGGYLWFLYQNREVSYRSALEFTISNRQQKLYQMKGVDLRLWESFVNEANVLRKEIKTVAAEYEADWDERTDEQDETVTKALKQERGLQK
jgi:hypothetical protein